MITVDVRYFPFYLKDVPDWLWVQEDPQKKWLIVKCRSCGANKNIDLVVSRYPADEIRQFISDHREGHK